MGEVYRVRDTTLDRDVALKVLSDSFTSDPDRLARFEREAKLLASLNHPNIGTIYGLEEAEGGRSRALVLEFVEGPTLADLIGQGPMTIDEALPIARQIVTALEAAHSQGIIHRDLKPANVKVRDDGTVKLLDFGLARPVAEDDMQTVTEMTIPGRVFGTPGYMAPEQLSATDVDARADLSSGAREETGGPVSDGTRHGRGHPGRHGPVGFWGVAATTGCDALGRVAVSSAAA